ncbi:MAG: transglycosylase SLT domain-containing protein [Xanthomonadales bacterium]|nr:transglycosylase SLT domain-containing protein [Xanthomonadales bacterium]
MAGLIHCAGAMAAGPDGAPPGAGTDAAQREAFIRAWQAAERGERSRFEQAMPGLQDYLLYPYLRYEDLRHRRAQVEAGEMAGFLEAHADWAFSPGLTTAWLRTLGAQERWGDVLAHAGESDDIEVRCHFAHARIVHGDTEDLLPAAQSLWAAGRSQPDACDPVFRWLQDQGGITPGLAWERIRLAMEARQPRLTLYLARYLDEADRGWADRWYQQDRDGYRQLDQAAGWPDTDKRRDIVDYGLRRLARSDPDRAWRLYQNLEQHIVWPGDRQGHILGEIALWSAVEGLPETPRRMGAVPESARDDRLLEWWARYDLARGNWREMLQTIDRMSPTAMEDSRWRYWKARALLETGATEAGEALLAELAGEASYHGFLAADRLDLPYTICPEAPAVAAEAIDGLARQAGFDRALELRRAGIGNWARGEWAMAARKVDKQGLRTAAALAVREGWPQMAIFALGDSGDQRWYEWRFPLDYVPLVDASAEGLRLDASWVMGLMRSESALAEDAVSPAGARGLMQVMPGTARQLAQRHGLDYTDAEQLLQAEDNIRFGTAYLRDLLDRYGDNPMLATGAYNAGPGAVDRWVDERRAGEPAIWVETLPYFETRDYIPRVLAFTTLYDWRMQRPVSRISSRMPAFDSAVGGGTMQSRETAEVVCPAPG